MRVFVIFFVLRPEFLMSECGFRLISRKETVELICELPLDGDEDAWAGPKVGPKVGKEDDKDTHQRYSLNGS